MQKFRWSLYKTLEFLNSRRPDLEIRAAFVSQLADFEQKLIAQGRGPQTTNWNEVADKNIVLNKDNFHEDEELLLRNTFMNAHMLTNKGPNDDNEELNKPEIALMHKTPKQISPEDKIAAKIQWIDKYDYSKPEVNFEFLIY
jgi:hypothetical protein